MNAKEIIKAHLEQMAAQDATFAARYHKEGKTLDNCWKYIVEQAQKAKEGNCACIADDVVFGWAVHYYQEDDVEPTQKPTPAVKVAAPSAPKPSAPKAQQKKNCQFVQLDLFDNL